jgi:hypothetical protein
LKKPSTTAIPSCAFCTIRPIDGDPSGVRAGAHEDINVITLLLGAEEAGLQVKTQDRRLAAGPAARRRAGDQCRRHAAAPDQ